jgi:putative tryptophan/tyrosine transport system substrate-binding protein
VRRRALLNQLGRTALGAWPALAWSQPRERIRRVGVLLGGTDDAATQPRIAAFRQGMKELKWNEGENLRLDTRFGAGDIALIRSQVAEIIALAPDVIFASNTPVLKSLKAATQTIPVVFAGLSDPVGDGIVASLASPGGNITGFASFNGPIAGIWLQKLKEIAPATRRVAVVYNPDTAPHALFAPALDATAAALGIALIRAAVREPASIQSALATLAGEPGGAVVVLPDVFTTRHRALIIALSAQHRLPAIWPLREWVPEGALMAYGPDFVDQYRRAAAYVDRVLRGARPGDLAVQQPTKFEMAINLKTAKALGLTVPPLLLAQADEVIE